MELDNPRTLDEQLMALKTRPYTKRQCKCPNCQTGKKIVGLSGRKLHNCHWPGCEKVFDDASRLLVHVQRHKGQREYVCDWPGCGREFFRKDHLMGHHKNHTGENITCKVCGYKAAGKSSLGTHMAKCHEKKFKCTCPNCEAPEDKRVVGPDGRRLHLCHYKDCDRVFDAVSRLQIHIQRHIGEKSYACLWDNCDRKFYRKDHLKTHLMSHNFGQMYVCPVCEYKFAWKNSLESHMKTHEIPKSPPAEKQKEQEKQEKDKKTEVKEPVPIRIVPNPGTNSPSPQPVQAQEPKKVQLKKSDRSAFEEIKRAQDGLPLYVPQHLEQAWQEYFYFQHQQHLYSQYLMQVQAFEEQRLRLQPPIIRPVYHRPW